MLEIAANNQKKKKKSSLALQKQETKQSKDKRKAHTFQWYYITLLLETQIQCENVGNSGKMAYKWKQFLYKKTWVWEDKERQNEKINRKAYSRQN